MSNKENYFPPNTDINTINETLYTDYSFLDTQSTPEDNILDSKCESINKSEISLEPPF